MNKKPKKIGLITTTSLVVGNMIGVGIFVLPAALASYGSISLLGWMFTSVGALVLAKIFSKLSKIVVAKSGGPYAYTREGFGDFIGFLVAWGYWISCWVGNGAIAIAIVGALSFFFPILETHSVYQVILGLSLIWLFTWINTRGVKASGRVQVVTTVLKILPLLFVIIVGLFYFRWDNFPAFNLTGESNFATFPVVAALTLYAFIGIECATIPAENVKDSSVTVPKATLLGTLIATIIYISSTIVLFGVLPIEALQASAAPFAKAAKLIAGEFGGYFVAIGVIISGLGVLNGWILVTGQMPMAISKDHLFPKLFKKENRNGAPYIGLIIGSLLSSVVMLMNFSEGLVEQFQLIVEITVFSALIPYFLTSAAYVIIVINRKLHLNNWVTTFLLGGVGMAFSLWALFGSGPNSVFYGFMLLLMGVPIYLFMKWNQRER